MLHPVHVHVEEIMFDSTSQRDSCIKSRGNNSSHVSVSVNYLANFSHISDILVEPKSSSKANFGCFFNVDNL